MRRKSPLPLACEPIQCSLRVVCRVLMGLILAGITFPAQAVGTHPIPDDTEIFRPFFPAPVAETSPAHFDYQYEVAPAGWDTIPSAFHFYLHDTLSYNRVEGVTTFRGNNYRNGMMYGCAGLSEKQFEKVWTNKVGRIDKWTGFGWTGQPAVVKWDKEVLAISNVHDALKKSDEFVEVICGSLDGKVYFYDLYSGKPSRPVITLPSSIKGSVWVDPRGYPLLYVGQGIDEKEGKKTAIGFYIYSLLNGKRLHFLNGIDAFAFRKWGAFDSNGLICPETDCIFLAGENGLIYAGKLNTCFDRENATISVNPQWYKYRYRTSKNIGSRLLGVENSVAAYRNYAFFADNAGILQCMDMNTLSPVWVQYVNDDTDATTAIDEEEAGVFLYTGCEVDIRAKNDSTYLRKINAATGEIVWENAYLCTYNKAVNGGLLSSPLIGQHNLCRLVFFSIARTGGESKGKLLAFDKLNGELVWEVDADNYSWSSPVAAYSEDHEGFLILADSKGVVHLYDGLTGEELHSIDLDGENVEASPALYNDMLVVGTRGQKIHGIKLK